jgi:hypothetical protein
LLLLLVLLSLLFLAAAAACPPAADACPPAAAARLVLDPSGLQYILYRIVPYGLVHPVRGRQMRFLLVICTKGERCWLVAVHSFIIVIHPLTLILLNMKKMHNYVRTETKDRMHLQYMILL